MREKWVELLFPEGVALGVLRGLRVVWIVIVHTLAALWGTLMVVNHEPLELLSANNDAVNQMGFSALLVVFGPTVVLTALIEWRGRKT